MTNTSTDALSGSKDATFRQETTIVATRLRAALIQVVNQSVGVVQKTRDLRDHLGLDYQISWQLYKILTSTQPLEFCVHVPTSAQLQRLLKGLKRKGAAAADLEAADTAWRDFERHVVHYAQTRDKFDAMIAHIVGGESREDMELAFRRQGFEVQRFVWGVETKVSVRTRILHPSTTGPGKYDLINILIKQGVTSFNPKAPILVDGREKKSTPRMGDDIPLDRQAYQRYGTSLISQFCSQTELPLQTRERGDGALVTYLLTDTIGYPSSVDLAFGRLQRPWRFRDKGNRLLDRFSSTISTPVTRSVDVILCHRPSIKNVQTSMLRFGRATNLPATPDGLWPEDLTKTGYPELPFSQNFTFMGNGRSAVEMAEVPQQLGCVEYACQSQGWNLDDMDVYQCSVDYPLMDSMVVMDFSFDK